KKYYFLNEAGKLKRYETQLRHADLVIAITPGDAVHFRKFHKNVITIPAFHTYDKIEIREGIGKYAIYHGNLSVPENVQAASYLISRVFNDLSVQLVITGNKPTRELKTLAAQYPNIDLKPNPSSNKISGLIRNAHINILPTFQSTGIKLKLLASLFGGRHCIVNSQMVDSTGLESQCIIADSDQEMKDQVVRMMDVPFDEAGILDRRNVLLSGFSNTLNAQRMVKELF
ncbi:MAG: mannosyltransferase, partial [Bacteroidetes bacterium]|nr:mannosyltransferase [Bacteroidota bacterium]